MPFHRFPPNSPTTELLLLTSQASAVRALSGFVKGFLSARRIQECEQSAAESRQQQKKKNYEIQTLTLFDLATTLSLSDAFIPSPNVISPSSTAVCSEANLFNPKWSSGNLLVTFLEPDVVMITPLRGETKVRALMPSYFLSASHS
jgi:hypothetical protein